MTDGLDKSDFQDWLKNRITKEVFLVLTENREFLKESILTLDTIFDANLERKMAYLRGSLEICDKVLGMTFEQLFNKEEEVKSENEETPYSW